MKSKSYGKLFLFTFISILLLTSTACSSTNSLQILNQDLTTRQFQGQTNTSQSMAAVTGTAKNMESHSITGCEITVTFFDERGQFIGVASTTRDSLGVGEVWNFTVQLTNPDAWKARSYKMVATSS